MLSRDANRSHSRPAADPCGGLVITWIRSGGTCSAQSRRIASVSCTRQNHHCRRSASTDSRSITSESQSSQLRALRCLTVSCHSAGSSVAMSRTVSTTCTWAGWSERTAWAAWPGSAAENSSCEMTAVFPGCLAWLGQDLPLAGPGPRRVGGQLLDAAQVLAGPEMVLGVVPGQHDALGGQLGAVAPQHLLDKGRAGLGLPDVQEDPGLSGAQRCQLASPRGFWVMVRLTRQDSLPPRPAGRISTQAIVGEGSPNAVRKYLRTNLHTADKPPMLYNRASGPPAPVPPPAARIS